MTRRFAALVAALLTFSAAHAEPVRVDGGLIEGKALDNGVTGWLGVPFAAPPLRDLRWKAPQPVLPWTGVMHAERFAPMCMQPVRTRTMNHYFGNEAISEDCLYLNIWAPAEAAGKKLPVIVWIYGGGFNVGSASMANYSGAGLARDGVIYVAANYRVGPLGFLAHPELTAEGGGHSGNYGLMDQVAALAWVQRNIAAFGGDPGNVTIMGQSAGSASVAMLMMNPRARGLFHKAVGMSVSPFGNMLRPVPLAKGEAQGISLQQALGAGSVEAMRDIGPDRILAAASGLPRDAIVIDGENITGTAEEVFAAHRQNDVPTIVGFTRDERFASIGSASTVAEYQTAVRNAFGANADGVLKAYPVKGDDGVARAMTDIARDMSVGSQMFNWAVAVRTNGKSPVWAYHFTRRQPYVAGIRFSDHDPATVGAYHTGEVPYFLRTLDSLNLFRKTRDWTPLDLQLRDIMSGIILSFAKTGTPGPNWPQFDARNPQVMMLGEDVRVAPWPNARALPLLVEAKAVVPTTPTPGRPRD